MNLVSTASGDMLIDAHEWKIKSYYLSLIRHNNKSGMVVQLKIKRVAMTLIAGLPQTPVINIPIVAARRYKLNTGSLVIHFPEKVTECMIQPLNQNGASTDLAPLS
jgi:hypothetical protein